MIYEAERLEALPNEKAAFEYFKIINKKFPGNVYVLTKCSELCSRIGNRESDPKSRDTYYQAGIIYAKQALKIDPKSDDAHVSYAIALGRTSLLKGSKAKIADAKEIKNHADIALKINPSNFKAWHIIGKWNFEVSNLSMFERAATKVFYGGLPGATLMNAIIAYEKARSLKTGFLLNHLELAKAYKRNDDDKKAIASLKQILSLPGQTEDDPRIKKEANMLLKQWN
jgi:tetratricopeptide (TPR) repeat protein